MVLFLYWSLPCQTGAPAQSWRNWPQWLKEYFQEGGATLGWFAMLLVDVDKGLIEILGLSSMPCSRFLYYFCLFSYFPFLFLYFFPFLIFKKNFLRSILYQEVWSDFKGFWIQIWKPTYKALQQGYLYFATSVSGLCLTCVCPRTFPPKMCIVIG